MSRTHAAIFRHSSLFIIDQISEIMQTKFEPFIIVFVQFQQQINLIPKIYELRIYDLLTQCQVCKIYLQAR